MTQVESKSGRRLLAVIMSVMMMLAFMPLLPGISEMAYAQDTWDGTAATAYAGGSGTAGSPYQIATGEQLKLLANQVNAGTDLSGKYYKLTDDISLNDLAWTPIGGVSGENSSYIPNGNYFKGTFDGNGKTISGLNVSVNPTSTSNFCGWGLFGCSNGAIKNLTVSGSISIASTASRSPEYVGGIVGYTQSDVYNCHTNVTIDVSNASATYEGSNVGGIAGAIERTDTGAMSKPFHVQGCSAKGSIRAGKRVGGVVGGVYCKNAGNVIVDNCFYSNGSSTPASITTTVDSSKVWSGGVVGYCKGYITNCYAVASLTASGGHYLCGAVGVLNGSGPQAKMENTYAAASFTNGASGYDKALFGSCDRSNTVSISHCLYDHDLSGTTYANAAGTGTNGWGLWTKSGYGTTTQLKGTDSSDNKVTVYTSNGSRTDESTSETALEVLGSSFAEDSNSYNTSYPVLTWQNSASSMPVYVEGKPASEASESGIFLNGTNGNDDSTGATRATAVKTLSRALSLAGTDTTIYVTGTVSLTGSELDLDGGSYDGITIKRSAVFTGALFEVPVNVTASVTAVTLDGNKDAVSATTPLIYVDGGTLNLGTDAVLTNDRAADGGAIYVNSGTASMSAGSITKCEADRGGAVYVAAGGTFTMSGGTIGGTSANANAATSNGGAVHNRGSFTMSGGTVSNNSADNGGAVGNMGSGTFTMSGGTLSDNSAAISGAGVYVNAGTTFNLGCSGISTNQVVYLANATGSSDPMINLNSELTSTITIQCKNPASGIRVAVGDDANITSSSLSNITYVNSAYSFAVDSSTYIKIL